MGEILMKILWNLTVFSVYAKISFDDLSKNHALDKSTANTKTQKIVSRNKKLIRAKLRNNATHYSRFVFCSCFILISQIVSGCPKACYTLFVTVCKQWPNHFLWKKLSFVIHNENMSTRYSSLTAVFTKMNFVHKYPLLQWKKYFVFIKRLPTLANVFHKKVFFLRNAHESRWTIHYSHFAWISSSFANRV